MKNSTAYLRTALCVCFLPVLLCAADDDDHSIRRLSIGIRVESFPQHSFQTSTLETATSPPSYTYFGSSASRKAAVGPAVEYRFWRPISLGVEFRGWYERLLTGSIWAYSAAMVAMLVCLELFGVTDAAIPFVYFQF